MSQTITPCQNVLGRGVMGVGGQPSRLRRNARFCSWS